MSNTTHITHASIYSYMYIFFKLLNLIDFFIYLSQFFCGFGLHWFIDLHYWWWLTFIIMALHWKCYNDVGLCQWYDNHEFMWMVSQWQFVLIVFTWIICMTMMIFINSMIMSQVDHFTFQCSLSLIPLIKCLSIVNRNLLPSPIIMCFEPLIVTNLPPQPRYITSSWFS